MSEKYFRQILEPRLHGSPQGEEILATLLSKTNDFVDSGLADPTFEKQFFDGVRSAFYQRLWEVNLAHYLWDNGYEVNSEAEGPDFSIIHDGIKIWIEAVSPIPEKIPDEYIKPNLEEGKIRVYSLPEREILLRITGAILNKQRVYNKYQKKGIVDEKDICIIAVDCAQLGIHGDIGINQKPSILNATYPVGHQQVTINTETNEVVDTGYALRLNLVNDNGAPVPTTPFVDQSYSQISAVIGARSGIQGVEKLNIVHNLTAENGLPVKLFTAEREFVANEENETVVLSNILEG